MSVRVTPPPSPPPLAVQRHAYLLLVQGKITALDYTRAISGRR